MNKEVVVVGGVRTAIGKFGGSLKDLAPTELATIVVREVEAAAELELQAHVAQLPLKVLLPLLFFQFPAYLLLLLGPVLRELSRSLGS